MDETSKLTPPLLTHRECYCGTSLGSTATEAHPEDCGVPCEGNTTVACGGPSFMLIYKLTAPADDTPRDKTDTSASGGIDGGSTGRKSSPGITAAVAMGSICGSCALLLVSVLGARRWVRRRQRRAGRGHQRGPGTGGQTEDTQASGAGTIPPLDEAGTGDAAGVGPRRLGGVVMDGQPPPVDRPTPDDGPSSRRPPYLSRTREVISAATGAEWRVASPATPRGRGGTSPQPVSAAPEGAAWDDMMPHTPSILVQHPDGVAQGRGLGERAWNRRRLSAPFPPAGYTWEDGGGAGGEEEAGRRASSPRGEGAGARVAGLGPAGGLVPPPLDLPRPGRGDRDDGSALAGEDGALLSPRWTTWTKWSLPSSSPVAGLFEDNVRTSEKAGKTE